jgi:hypothetical protein
LFHPRFSALDRFVPLTLASERLSRGYISHGA